MKHAAVVIVIFVFCFVHSHVRVPHKGVTTSGFDAMEVSIQFIAGKKIVQINNIACGI